MNNIAGVEVGYTQPINNEMSEQSVNTNEALSASNDEPVQSLNTEERVQPIRTDESEQVVNNDVPLPASNDKAVLSAGIEDPEEKHDTAQSPEVENDTDSEDFYEAKEDPEGVGLSLPTEIKGDADDQVESVQATEDGLIEDGLAEDVMLDLLKIKGFAEFMRTCEALCLKKDHIMRPEDPRMNKPDLALYTWILKLADIIPGGFSLKPSSEATASNILHEWTEFRALWYRIIAEYIETCEILSQNRNQILR